MFDFQIQTTASDGKFSPRDCVRMAKENNLSSIAITDHDTVGGIDEALSAGAEFGIEVIPGIEMSCDHRGHGIHILGLGIDHKRQALLELLWELKREREHRAKLMVEKLQGFGFAVDYNEVRRLASGVVARPHIAEAVMENSANAEKLNAEGIKTRQDFFVAYIADGAKAYVHHVPLEAGRAIGAIRQAGGVTVWSHPTIPMADYKLVEETLTEFLRFGLDGIEVMGNFTEDDTEFLNMLAGKYGILKSAGSDFHDTYVNPEKPEEGAAAIGGFKTHGYSLDGISETLHEAMAKRSSVAA